MSYFADRDIGRTMVRRVQLIETIDDGDMQIVSAEGFADEIFKKVHRVQPYGHSSHAPKKSHGIVVSAGGRPDQGFLLGVEDANSRPRDLPEGANVLYDASGNMIYMHQKKIKITTDMLIIDAKDEVEINTPRLTVNAYIFHTGNMMTSGVHVDAAGTHR